VKTCTKCGALKPLSEFHKGKGVDNKKARCAVCCRTWNREFAAQHRDETWAKANTPEKLAERKAYAVKYYAANREKIKARVKQYVQENRHKVYLSQQRYRDKNEVDVKAKKKVWYYSRSDVIRTREKVYREATKDLKRLYDTEYRIENEAELKEKARVWRKENKEQTRLAQKAYREANPGTLKARKLKYRLENLEAEKRRNKAYRKANLDKISLANKAWRKANPEKVSAYSQARKAARRGATPAWAKTKKGKAEIREIYQDSRIKSDYSGKQHHVDHVIPLQGKIVTGLHCADNLRISRAYNNMTKGWSFDQEAESERQLIITLAKLVV